MDAARAAVSKITGRQGHTTEVDEVVNPAVTRETIIPTRHEQVQQAIDKEVHQDHYHTTVQPLQHREVLPEQHVHNMVPVQEREFSHGDHEGVKRNVQAELSQFRDSTTTHETQVTRSAAAAVTGEHVHHHVHETVQPIIHKEVVQPEVVHTTIPIHETHHAAAQHHGMSALPMKSLSEFTSSGGALTGSARNTHEEYEGGPRPYNKELQTSAEKVLHMGSTGTTGTGLTGSHTGHHGHHHESGREHERLGSDRIGSDRIGSDRIGSDRIGSDRIGSDRIGSDRIGSDRIGSDRIGSERLDNERSHENYADRIGNEKFGTTESGLNHPREGLDRDSRDTRDSTNTGSSTTHKPSLMDKLNPKVDSNGDGKAGFMK